VSTNYNNSYDLSDLIRSQIDDFKTPNIISFENENLHINLKNFRHLKDPIEFLLFYKFNECIYYPTWLEFRSINNNILHLIIELEIRDLKQLTRILKSSLKKEENIISDIQTIIYHTKSMPTFCTPIDSFEINDPLVHFIFEK